MVFFFLSIINPFYRKSGEKIEGLEGEGNTRGIHVVLKKVGEEEEVELEVVQDDNGMISFSFVPQIEGEHELMVFFFFFSIFFLDHSLTIKSLLNNRSSTMKNYSPPKQSKSNLLPLSPPPPPLTP